MDKIKLNEESFREACSYGDMESIISLCKEGVNINSQNVINGWTALHWACKREQRQVVRFLVLQGADPSIRNFLNESPAEVTTNKVILKLLDNPYGIPDSPLKSRLPSAEFSWLKPDQGQDTPKIGHSPDHCNGVTSDNSTDEMNTSNEGGSLCMGYPISFAKETCSTQTSPFRNLKDAQTSTLKDALKREIILKIRIAHISDTDFIEIDVPTSDLSYSYLLTTCSRELAINPQLVERVRKLPNTRLRNDKDTQRLKNLDELEFVVKGLSSRGNSVTSLQSQSMSNFKPVTNFKNQTILY